MKKSIIAIVVICVLLLSSCANVSDVVVYEEVNAYRTGQASAGLAGSTEGTYSFQTTERLLSYLDREEVKEETFYSFNESFEYFATKSFLGSAYYEEIYYNDDFMVFYRQGTDEIVRIKAMNLENPILRADGLTEKQDFVDYAKSIAKDFIEVEQYTVKIVPKDPPAENTATAYCGDEYTFVKQISGVDTAERLVVSITPEGAVGEIRHEAIGQFEAFDGITLDEALIQEAVGCAIDAAYPQTGGKIEIRGYEYYLINDGGTLLLYLELSATSTPIDEAATKDPSDPVLREEDTVYIGTCAVVPLAELKTK